MGPSSSRESARQSSLSRLDGPLLRAMTALVGMLLGIRRFFARFGKIIFGIGAGWLREESEIMGVDFRRSPEGAATPRTSSWCASHKVSWTTPDGSILPRYPAANCCEASSRK